MSGNGGFDPSVPAPGEAGAGTTTGYLPNGQYDIYNLGALWDKTLYLGYTTQKVPGVTPPHDYTGEGDIKPGGGIPTAPHTETVPSLSTPYDYMKEFAGWSVTDPQMYAALQQQLALAGFYGSSKPRYGIWSSDDATAMKKAITGYLGVVNPASPEPLTLNDFLDHAAAQGKKNAKEAVQQVAPIQLTDPTSIRAAAQSAFEAALGRSATDSELSQFVSQFQASQTSAEKAARVPGGDSYSMPDLSTQADAYAQQNNPKEFAKNQQQSYYDLLVNMLSTGASRPNQTPVAPVGG